MSNDILESVSQRGYGAYDAENRRIKENDEGRYSNGTYLVWDVVPRNVLVDADGDMYVVDAEIKRQ